MHNRRWLVKATLATLLLVLLAPGVARGSRITVHAHDLAGGSALSTFTYLVNVDNTRDPHASTVLDRTGIAPTESNSPIVAEGDQGSATTPDLPAGRYLISVRS